MRFAVPSLDAPGEWGLLSGKTWSSLEPCAYLVDARSGLPPRDGTAIRLAASPAALHVRFECDDRDIWGTHTRRDAPLWEEEAVEVFIAPGEADPARYAEIEMNPAGALFDAIVSNPDGRRDTMTVDAGWTAGGLVGRVSRPTDNRWDAELAIAWSSLAELGAPGGIWRANFFRIERPSGQSPEYSAWCPTHADPPDFHKPARFGGLVIR